MGAELTSEHGHLKMIMGILLFLWSVAIRILLDDDRVQAVWVLFVGVQTAGAMGIAR